VALPLIYSPDWETKNEKQFPTYIDFNVIQNSELHTHIGPTWGWGVYGKKLDFSSNTEHIYNEAFAVDNHTSISEGSPIFTAGFGGDPNVWHINDRNWIYNFLGKVPGDWDAHYGLMNFEEDHTFFKRHLSDDILEAYYHGCIEDSKAIIIDTTKNNTTFTSEHAREMPGRHHTYNYTYGMGKTPIIHYGELKSITISSQDVSGSNANPHRQMVTGTLDNTAYFAHKPNNIHPINDDDSIMGLSYEQTQLIGYLGLGYEFTYKKIGLGTQLKKGMGTTKSTDEHVMRSITFEDEMDATYSEASIYFEYNFTPNFSGKLEDIYVFSESNGHGDEIVIDNKTGVSKDFKEAVGFKNSSNLVRLSLAYSF